MCIHEVRLLRLIFEFYFEIKTMSIDNVTKMLVIMVLFFLGYLIREKLNIFSIPVNTARSV